MLVLHQIQPSLEVDSIKLISIWPDGKKIISLILPPDAIIGAVGGYGNYRMTALTELGRVEGVGDTLLQNSVSWLLGVPVHQVMRLSGAETRLTHESWRLRREGFLGTRSFPEAWTIAALLDQVKKGNMEETSVSEDNAVRQRVEADGSQARYFETALLDRLVAARLVAVWPEAAAVQVAAINASGKSQIAAAWSRYARLGGFDVVSVTEIQELKSTTRIIFSHKELEAGMVGKALRLLYPLATCEVGDTSQYRADIAIVYGLDSWKWLNDRTMYLE